ncbi:MAG: DinB family protein [Phycisphaerales bacterium]|nr:DinB family protein [Phycisphaerales bacterium]
MDRETLLRHWEEAWREGLWAAPWSRVLEGLTPPEAVWRPQPERHCIWQSINHMMFWRDVALRRLRGETVAAEERQRRNWEMPSDTSEAALDALRSVWTRSHGQVRAAIADERASLADLQNVAYHDSYHVGQIMLLRALQGLPPIE